MSQAGTFGIQSWCLLTHEKDKTNLKKRNKNSNVSMEHKAGGVLSVLDTFNL